MARASERPEASFSRTGAFGDMEPSEDVWSTLCLSAYRPGLSPLSRKMRAVPDFLATVPASTPPWYTGSSHPSRARLMRSLSALPTTCDLALSTSARNAGSRDMAQYTDPGLTPAEAAESASLPVSRQALRNAVRLPAVKTGLRPPFLAEAPAPASGAGLTGAGSVFLTFKMPALPASLARALLRGLKGLENPQDGQSRP